MNDSITNTVEKVDPGMAAELLAMNKGNRNVSQSAVKKMASDMLYGLWVYDGSPIRISSTGALLDGQHRLHAVIKSGIPHEFLIIRGLPDKVMQTMDQGRKRSGADAWTMAGGINGNTVAAAVKQHIRYLDTQVTPELAHTVWQSGTMPSQTEIVNAMLKRKDVIESVMATLPERRSTGLNYATFLTLALLVNDLSLYKDRWPEWTEVMRTGLGTSERDPRVMLRNYAIRGHGDHTSHDAAASQHRLSVYLKAWNAFVCGREIGVLRWRIDEGMPRVL